MGTVPQEETRNQYVADGIENTFIYSYFIPKEKDITIWVTPSGSPPNETVDIKILGVDYAVQNAGVPGGGTFKFLPGKIPGIGAIVTGIRSVIDSITTNYVDAKTIRGDNLDESFEREMLVTQQNVTNLDRTALRYQNNAFLPDSLTRNVVPTLDPNFFWKGSAAGGVIAVEDKEEAGCSSLRSELASEVQGVDGAGLSGYFDENRLLSTNVRTQLNGYGDPTSGQDGARLIGYYDPVNLIETSVGDQLDLVTGETDGLPEKLQNSFPIYGDDVGLADAMVVNIVPAYQAYVPGTRVFVKVANANVTQTPTLNLNGLGDKTITNKSGALLVAGDLQAGGIYEFIYDGVDFQSLTSPHNRTHGEFSSLSLVSVTNTTTETSLIGNISGSNVIPANFLTNGSAYRFSLIGSYQDTLETPIFLRIKSNGTTLFGFNAVDWGKTPLAFTPVLPLAINVDIVFRSVGNPSTIYANLEITNGSSSIDYRLRWNTSFEGVNTTDFNSEIDNTLDLTLEWNNPGPQLSMNIESFTSAKVF